MLKANNKKTGGQSLIEITVAVAIMGLVLTSMVAMSTLGLKTVRLAKDRSVARHLIENKFEEIRRGRDEDKEGFFSQGTRTLGVENVGTSPVYALTVSYTEIVVGEQYEVTVFVTWMDGENTYSVTQSTYLSKWQ